MRLSAGAPERLRFEKYSPRKPGLSAGSSQHAFGYGRHRESLAARQHRAGHERNGRRASRAPHDSIAGRNQMLVRAVVALAAVQEHARRRTDHGELLRLLRVERQDAVVLEEDERLARRVERESAVLGAVDDRHGDGGVGISLRRIEHAETKSRGEHAAERAVHLRFGKNASPHRTRDLLGVGFAALEIATGA